MAQVCIPFKADFEYPMLSGKKYATSRTKKLGHTGDTFEAWDALFVILEVKHLPLSEIAKSYHEAEGFDTPAGFRHIWREIHPERGFDPGQWVWIHFFKLVRHPGEKVLNIDGPLDQFIEANEVEIELEACKHLVNGGVKP